LIFSDLKIEFSSLPRVPKPRRIDTPTRALPPIFSSFLRAAPALRDGFQPTCGSVRAHALAGGGRRLPGIDRAALSHTRAAHEISPGTTVAGAQAYGSSGLTHACGWSVLRIDVFFWKTPTPLAPAGLGDHVQRCSFARVFMRRIFFCFFFIS
jgi:hypothetical protein